MNIRTVHQILIGSSIALCVIFSLRGFVLFFQGQGARPIIGAVLSAGVAVGLALYLRRFREKLRAPSASSDAEPKGD